MPTMRPLYIAGSVEIFANDSVRLLVCVSQITGQLQLGNAFGCEGEGERVFVARLDFPSD